MTTVATDPAVHSEAQELVRQYHDARRKEDQWRIPQILSALATPLLALISAALLRLGDSNLAMIAATLTVIVGTAAALLAVEVWRWHRTAIGIGNSVRTDYSAEATLLLRDPL